jgi:hypothetical protein
VRDAVVGGGERDRVRELVPQHLRPVERPIVISPLRGETSAITRPVLAPTVPIHGEPVVRTLNASCVGKTSMYVFTAGSCLNRGTTSG